jgi:hypothetical protein
MTRTGKIARLPRNIRDELNRRLDNGEQGVRLIEWLNGLPEVKQVLARDFEGRPITKCNLTEWKNGGYLDWQSESETAAFIREINEDDTESSKIPPSELAKPLTTTVLAHYAQAIFRSLADHHEQPRARVRRLGRSLREMDRIMRRELSEERMQIELEQFQFEQEKLDLKKLWHEIEHATESKPGPTGQTPTNTGGLTKFDPV